MSSRWIWYRLQEKFCAGRHPRVIHGAPSVDHIFQELYAVPEQIKTALLPHQGVGTAVVPRRPGTGRTDGETLLL